MALLRVHAPLDLLLVFRLFLNTKLLLSSLELELVVIALLAEAVSEPAREPPADLSLDVESGPLALLEPHLGREVGLWVYDLVLPSVDVQVAFLHLRAELAHHDCRLRLVLVGLDDSLVPLRVVAGCLVCLGEGVVIGLTGLGAAEATDVGLEPVLLFYLHRHDLDLVVRQADLDLEHVRHHELVGLDRVVVVAASRLLLLPWYVHLVLPSMEGNVFSALHLHVLLLLLLIEVFLVLGLHVSANGHRLLRSVTAHLVAHVYLVWQGSASRYLLPYSFWASPSSMAPGDSGWPPGEASS